jgi:uncharacterized FlaG/YvyC family protein
MEIAEINNSIQEAPKEFKEKASPKPEKSQERQKPIPLDFHQIALKGNIEKQLKAVAEHLNREMQRMQYSLQFMMDKEGKKIVIKVLDGKGNLIRQIPPEEMQTLSASLGGDVGILLNETL